MPNTDPRTRRRADDQYDYEDPIDRYRPPDDRPKVKKKKAVNPNAIAAYRFGLISLVPVLGFLFGPLAVLFGIVAMRYAREHPDAGGKGRAKSGIWFGLLACFINYGLPAIFFILAYFARVR